MTDRRALTQFIINLANNAIKFTSVGAVRVEVGQGQIEGKQATEISVVDTGVGIRAEDQVKLFQAFEASGSGAAASRAPASACT